MPANTPNFTLPYPLLTDAADMEDFGVKDLAVALDTLLAPPTQWRTVFSMSGVVSGLTTATYGFATAPGVIVASGSTAGSVGGLWHPSVLADEAVPGRTTRLRTRVCYAVNATAPGITLTWGLYPVASLAGGSGVIGSTLSTVVTGSTAAVASPSGGSTDKIVSASFDLSTLASQLHVPGITGSGSEAAASVVAFQFFIEMRHT